jgi:2-polyprenyl-3-methyl-5-hydroxy-6-metoxy-1,4-benzoquinol methylase
VEKLGLGPGDRVLDLGSEDGSYLASYYPYRRQIVLADIKEEPIKRGAAKYGLGGYILIDPDGPLPIKDGEFDAVWCNSVIEHVTVAPSELAKMSLRQFLARAEERQRQFASEVSRVGRQYFVQTPYLHFPIEAHSWLPAVQYLPHHTQVKLSRLLKKVWVKQWTADFRLYDRARFRSHFPGATLFLQERVLGLTKSIIAVRQA